MVFKKDSEHMMYRRGGQCTYRFTAKHTYEHKILTSKTHLRDGIEQTRNDAGGLGLVEAVLLDNGIDEIELGNVVFILANGGAGREGGRR